MSAAEVEEEFPRPIRSYHRDITGEVPGNAKDCTLNGCRGIRYYVRWEDGRTSWVCSHSITTDDDGTWRIG